MTARIRRSHPSRFAACWLALGLTLPAPGPAAIHYQAPLDEARWQLERGKNSCLLAHAIPRYGRVVVEGVPGGAQRLYLDAYTAPLGRGAGMLVASAPFWNPDRAERALGAVQVGAGLRPVELDTLMTQRVLDTLADGLVPTLSGPLDGAGMSSRISVLPVAFRKAYESYRECLAKLPALPIARAKAPSSTPVAQAARSQPGVRAAFSFASHQSELAPVQRAELDRIVAELKGNAQLTATIDGYGNDSQRRLLNLELSRRRADAVRDHLVAAGVAAARVETNYHGGRQTAGGRRVEIRLAARPSA